MNDLAPAYDSGSHINGHVDRPRRAHASQRSVERVVGQALSKALPSLERRHIGRVKIEPLAVDTLAHEALVPVRFYSRRIVRLNHVDLAGVEGQLDRKFSSPAPECVGPSNLVAIAWTLQ